MHKPPFKLASAPVLRGTALGADRPPPTAAAAEDAAGTLDALAPGRARLGQLDPHLHCSILGTCLGANELRRLMARFLDLGGASDLDVHHEAVRLAAQGGQEARALHKALDHRHEATLARFGRARDAAALGRLWDEASQRGEIPGAYWAVMSHCCITPELRQRVFGEVHMLSHLVGAANRADLRRLVALEREVDELRARLEEQQMRSLEASAARERSAAALLQELDDTRRRLALTLARQALVDAGGSQRKQLDQAVAAVALQTQRREQAEQAAAVARNEVTRIGEQLDHGRRHAAVLRHELAAAEAQLRETGAGTPPQGRRLDQALRGRRLLYVGGRPSSTPAIRDLVLRHGGEFRHHDGGLEDRKGLMASSIAWAQMVVFPVDCVDHDSAGNLKRLCARQGIPYFALRCASVASFAAGLSARLDPGDADGPDDRPFCPRHS